MIFKGVRDCAHTAEMSHLFLSSLVNMLLIGLVVLLILLVLKTMQKQMTCLVNTPRPLQAAATQGRVFRMHRLYTDERRTGEALVLVANVGGVRYLFLLDTGYAGAPVLSTSYLAYARKTLPPKSIAEEFISAVKGVSRVGRLERISALQHFIAQTGSVTYTSGCTMRLMSIGSVQEQQADMILTRPIAFEMDDKQEAFASPKIDNTYFAAGDVLVSNPLPHAIHILTADFLFHMAPCLIAPKEERLEMFIDAARMKALRASFVHDKVSLSGGAVVLTVKVGGVPFRVTMDTGSPTGISLGKNALRRFKCSDSKKIIRQIGVNRETICSSIVGATVEFANTSHTDVAVLINDSPVADLDGYAGMGFLRAFDILLTRETIGFRSSSLPMYKATEYSGTMGTCSSSGRLC